MRLAELKMSILAALGVIGGCTSGDASSSPEPLDSSNASFGDDTSPTPWSGASESDDDGSWAETATMGPARTTGGSESEGPRTDDCDGEHIVQAGFELSSGFERCADGQVRRVKSSICMAPNALGSDDPNCTNPMNGCVAGGCNDAAFGACIASGPDYCYCTYGCATDSDCSEGEICMCGLGDPDLPSVSSCIPALCQSDADCGGLGCRLAVNFDGCGPMYMMACHTPEDECQGPYDCGFGCSPGYEGVWRCSEEGGCAEGRPFYVEGALRVARTVARDDWRETFAVAPGSDGELHTTVRAVLADHYRRSAVLEHASVASFSRFVLQLLMIGAPADLLVQAQQAIGDEIRHAKLVFALASRYGGTSWGPGPLDVRGSLEPSALDFESILRGVIEEACVSETLAAIEAHAALGEARDAAARAALEVIAADELRHAQLGWRTLRWGLERSDASTRTRLLAYLHHCVDRAWMERPEAIRHPEHAVLATHGMLDDQGRRRVVELGLREVVAPAVCTLERTYAGRARRFECSPSDATCLA